MSAWFLDSELSTCFSRTLLMSAIMSAVIGRCTLGEVVIAFSLRIPFKSQPRRGVD